MAVRMARRVMPVIMGMWVIMTAPMRGVMPMRVIMPMRVVVLMGAVMQPLRGPRSARILAEDQRLDGHRHGVGGQPDAPKIDVVEIHQHDAVDHQDFALDAEFFPQDGAERLGHVAVEHDIDRLPPRDAAGKTAANAFGEARQPLIGGRPLPTERQRDLALLGDIEHHQVAVDGRRDRVRVD